ncbi:MAG: hypothetical protein PHF44_03400 [Candidatus Pacebacteria bacterium]|nr:hypothetical protein [Candidatus Paceibacterota bacterium]
MSGRFTIEEIRAIRFFCKENNGKYNEIDEETLWNVIFSVVIPGHNSKLAFLDELKQHSERRDAWGKELHHRLSHKGYSINNISYKMRKISLINEEGQMLILEKVCKESVSYGLARLKARKELKILTEAQIKIEIHFHPEWRSHWTNNPREAQDLLYDLLNKS